MPETVEMDPVVVALKRWPRPPQADDKSLNSFYGSFKYEELSGGNVRILGDWVQDNIVTLKIQVRGPKRSRRIQVHRTIAPMLEDLMGEIFYSCPDYAITQFGGFCPRHKMHDPRRGLSVHSWGAAIDINWDTNPVSKKLITDFPEALIKTFESALWTWGGRWVGTKDTMHFQYTRG